MQRYVFLILVICITAASHYYLWARLVRNPGLPRPWRLGGTVVLTLLGLSMPLAFILRRVMGSGAPDALMWIAFTWMGLFFLCFLLVGVADLIMLLLRSGGVARPERRVFLARLLGGASAAAAGLLGVIAVRRALSKLIVKEVAVTLPRLPAALDGTTIVQLTDIHVGPTIGKGFIEEIVARVNALSPDVVAITGDLVDGSVEELRAAVAPLGGLKARHGVFFVTGNHEYYAGVHDWLAELGRLGIRVLRNERVAIGGDGGFDLAGVDDFNAQGGGHGPDLPSALKGRHPARELVLLAHQPRAVHEAARLGVGLQLSGHTHAGQIWPWNYLVKLQQPYVHGLYSEGETQLYVSPGTGYWGPPMRLGSTAEITRVVLSARKA